MRARLVSLDYYVPLCDTSLDALPVVIGQAEDAEIRLDDFSVADYHCRVSATDDGLTVTDLDTVHGTYVNGTRVTESVLTPGDELSIGMMTFLVQPAAEAAEPRRPSRTSHSLVRASTGTSSRRLDRSTVSVS